MVDNAMTTLLGRELVTTRHCTVEIDHIDGQFRSMCLHFYKCHCYVELHVLDMTITALDNQEKRLGSKGCLESTLTC